MTGDNGASTQSSVSRKVLLLSHPWAWTVLFDTQTLKTTLLSTFLSFSGTYCLMLDFILYSRKYYGTKTGPTCHCGPFIQTSVPVESGQQKQRQGSEVIYPACWGNSARLCLKILRGKILCCCGPRLNQLSIHFRLLSYRRSSHGLRLPGHASLAGAGPGRWFRSELSQEEGFAKWFRGWNLCSDAQLRQGHRGEEKGFPGCCVW